MKWILFLMLFTTPAANVTNKADQKCLTHSSVDDLGTILQCRPDYEGRHIWSLQSASQLEFSNLESCVKTQDQLIANSNVASTMTLRSWCFCDSSTQQCPTDQDAADYVSAIRICKINPKDAKCDAARKTTKSFTTLDPAKPEGQNATSIQLYPPPPQQRPSSR